MRLFIITLLFCFQTQEAQASSEGPEFKPIIDSLKRVLKEAGHDTTRCSVLNAMIDAEGDDGIWPQYNEQLKLICEANLKKYRPSDPLYNFFYKNLATYYYNLGYLAHTNGEIPQALKYYEQSLKLYEEIKDKSGIAFDLNNMAILYQYQGDIPKALELNNRSLALRKEIQDQRGTAESLNNIGLIYNDQGNEGMALEAYQQSLRIQEKINDKDGMATSFNNIGAIYQHQGDDSKALFYFTKSLKIQEEVKNNMALAGALHNIANIYKRQGQADKALDYLHKSYDISEEDGYIPGMAHCLNSMAAVYRDRGDVPRAIAHWNQSIQLWEKINDKQGLAMTLNNMVLSLLASGKIKEAQHHAERELKLALELGYPENIKDASAVLSKIYSKTGRWKEAYDLQVLFKTMSDSISRVADRKAFLQKSFQYEYEKKVAADSIRAVQERRVFDVELKQQKTQRTALYVGIGLVALFALFMYNRFRVTQKQKHIIEGKEKETQVQKQIIEEKHKEISDSINYAGRIQRSFLASTEILNQHLKDYFILFKPKDIVSGDFYWAAKLNNGRFALAAADSTGHGVPGAIMSLLNITSLEKAIEQVNDPSEILNRTRKTIIERLKNDGSVEGGKDGMDCCLVVFDFEMKQLTMSGAYNPLWIIRQETAGPKLIEIRSDKMPVGKHDRDHVSFTLQTFDFQKDDIIYLITDGFADQFGGPAGKKFKYKQMEKVILSASKRPMPEQKKVLENAFETWKGALEQVDDICIVAVRV